MALTQYHSDEICNESLQAFASNIHYFLTDDPPRYDDALNKISMCYEIREAHSKNRFGQIDQAHQNVLNLLSNLGEAIEFFKNRHSEYPVQVEYYDGPMRFMLYPLPGGILQVTSSGSTKVAGRRKTYKKNRKNLKLKHATKKLRKTHKRK